MRRFVFTAALSAALACLSLPLRAANLSAKVPFDFYVDKTALPAGEYNLEIGQRGLMVVRNALGKGAAITITLAAERADSNTQGLLVFHKIGDEYFLNQVWAPHSSEGCELRQSRREKEAYARASRTTVASVPARHE